MASSYSPLYTEEAKPSATSITKIMRKVSLRLMPLLILANILSYMDRVNVGFAAITANKDLGLTPLIYGFGASLFFLSYFLFELPSSLIMRRVGGRLWLSRIMITWGLVSACMSLVVGPKSFYLVRFLLGVCRGRIFPLCIGIFNLLDPV